MRAPHNNKNCLITATVFWTPTVYSVLLSVGGQKRASALKKLADQWGRGSCDEPNCMQWDEAIPEINREAQLPREGNPAHGEHLPWESGASTGWGEPRGIWAGETAIVEKGESLEKAWGKVGWRSAVSSGNCKILQSDWSEGCLSKRKILWCQRNNCDALEMATHSSILAWRIPWREEPGRLQSMGSQRVGHDWTTPLGLWLFLCPCSMFYNSSHCPCCPVVWPCHPPLETWIMSLPLESGSTGDRSQVRSPPWLLRLGQKRKRHFCLIQRPLAFRAQCQPQSLMSLRPPHWCSGHQATWRGHM